MFSVFVSFLKDTPGNFSFSHFLFKRLTDAGVITVDFLLNSRIGRIVSVLKAEDSQRSVKECSFTSNRSF